MNRSLGLCLLLATVLSAGGASCPRMLLWPQPQRFPQPPAVFNQSSRPPSLDQLASAVNRTQQIQQLQSNSTTVTLVSAPNFEPGMLGISRLPATIMASRPRGIRIQVNVPLTGQSAVDMGSNDELFWMKAPSGTASQLFFARHDAYAVRPQRALLPIDPVWILDALGLASIEPADQNDPPRMGPSGDIELVSRQLQRPAGMFDRVMRIDGKLGVVKEQFIYIGNDCVAIARGSDFRYYDGPRCSLPHQVDLELRPIGVAGSTSNKPIRLQLSIGPYSINQLLGDDVNRFALPRDGSEQVIDLTQVGPIDWNGPIGYGATANTEYSSAALPVTQYRGMR
jgi:hypothetical protein